MFLINVQLISADEHRSAGGSWEEPLSAVRNAPLRRSQRLNSTLDSRLVNTIDPIFLFSAAVSSNIELLSELEQRALSRLIMIDCDHGIRTNSRLLEGTTLKRDVCLKFQNKAPNTLNKRWYFIGDILIVEHTVSI